MLLEKISRRFSLDIKIIKRLSKCEDALQMNLEERK